MRKLKTFIAVLLLATTAFAEPEELPEKEALEKAKVGDKYRKLLIKFRVESDYPAYKEFYDYGHYTGSSWKGHSDLPPGYWVYVYPDWYIFGIRKGDVVLPEPEESPSIDDLEELKPLMEAPVVVTKRAYGPEQATGPPDVPVASDSSSAWCPATIDEADAWLEVEFEKPVIAKEILVYESYTPGALVRVLGYSSGGMEVELWSGNDPATADGSSAAVARVKTDVRLRTKRVRIMLNCGAISNWTEIDTVGVVDRSGKKHWPVKARANSCYTSGEVPKAYRIVDAF